MSTKDEIINILKDQLHLNEEDINLDSFLIFNLKCDSLDIIEIILGIEKRFNLSRFNLAEILTKKLSVAKDIKVSKLCELIDEAMILISTSESLIDTKKLLEEFIDFNLIRN